MAEFSKIVITKKGQSLIAKILAGGDGVEGVEFTNICASSAVLTVGELEELEVLTDIKQTSLISNKEITNATAIKVTTVILNSELTIGYYVRAIGLYAVDPDVGEILYGVTVETSGNCYMPPYNGVTVSGLYINLITSVGNAENVSLVIDPAAVATVGNIKELQEQIDMINVPNFTEATVRENIKTGDTLRVILGKIKKFFTDLNNVAFTGNYNDLSAKPNLGTGSAKAVANNCTTTADGFVLDARQGKVLNDNCNQLNSNITNINAKLNTGNLEFDYVESDGLYYEVQVGADTVRKKLGKSGYTIPAIIIQTGSMHHATNTVTVDVTDYSTLKIIVTIFLAVTSESFIMCKSHTITNNGTYEVDVKNNASVDIVTRAFGANNGTIRYAVEVK